MSRYLLDFGGDLMIRNKRYLFPFCSYSRCLLVFEHKIEKSSPEYKHYMYLSDIVNKRVGDLGGGYIL